MKHNAVSNGEVRFGGDVKVPLLVDGKRRHIALVGNFVSWDET